MNPIKCNFVTIVRLILNDYFKTEFSSAYIKNHLSEPTVIDLCYDSTRNWYNIWNHYTAVYNSDKNVDNRENVKTFCICDLQIVSFEIIL